MVPFNALLVACILGAASPGSDPPTDPDLAFVRECRVDVDGNGLLDFLRSQTLDDARQRRLESLIRQLGDRNFEKREEASQELAKAGRVALPLLRTAAGDRDKEIADRASFLVGEEERNPGPNLVAAVVRVVKNERPRGALRVLLDYLPSANDLYVEEEILSALAQLAPSDGPLDPVWAEARAEKAALRRGAAGFVLGQRRPAEDRVLAIQLLRDPEPMVRWQTARGLLVRRDGEAVPALIALLEEAPPEVAGQAKEVLARLADNRAAALDVADNRKATRAAWDAWWKENAGKVDLAKADAPPMLGLILGIEFNTDTVWERGRDGKLRWKVSASGPMDAQVLPNNRVLVAEATGKKVTERDFQGKVHWEHTFPGFPGEEPINCLRLRDGNTFIATRSGIHIVTPDHQERFSKDLPAVNACRYLPNGHFLYVTTEGTITELDPTGKQVRSFVKPETGHWKDAIVLPGNRWLLSGNTNVKSPYLLEIDAQGKKLWESSPIEACGVEQLPTGNFLLACPQKVVEVNRDGKIVWEIKGEGGYVRRAHIR
jgi:predicted Rdx family selenoprotein